MAHALPLAGIGLAFLPCGSTADQERPQEGEVGMRILVTGHNGYIGSVMVPVLRRTGHDVVGLDSFFFEDCTLLDEQERVPEIRKDTFLRDTAPTWSSTISSAG